MNRLQADLHGIIGGKWQQEGGSGRLTACWGVVHFPTGSTLAGAPYNIHDTPRDLHAAARLAAQRNRFEAEGPELFLALPIRWDGSEWQLARVQFTEEVTSGS